ncbi:MAG: hypothetical protein ACOH2F_11975 [Cellulomonas sp.]
MTTHLYGTLAVLAAAGSVPDSDLLAAVAAGLTDVHVDPWAEWYGIPAQHPAPPQSLHRTNPRPGSGPALTELPRRHGWT